MTHVCHAKGCDTPVPRRLLMCPRHWRMVPRVMQREIWRLYVPGQENDRTKVTADYLAFTRKVIDFVYRSEKGDKSYASKSLEPQAQGELAFRDSQAPATGTLQARRDAPRVGRPATTEPSTVKR